MLVIHKLRIDAQFLRLTKPQPEPVLQHKLDLVGNVATKRAGDLWRGETRLPFQYIRTIEREVPQLHGW